MVDEKQELKFEIINHIGVISTSANGWNFELNRVSWYGNEPKYDVRSWSADHTKMGKGITLTEDELIALSDLLNKEVAFLREE